MTDPKPIYRERPWTGASKQLAALDAILERQEAVAPSVSSGPGVVGR